MPHHAHYQLPKHPCIWCRKTIKSDTVYCSLECWRHYSSWRQLKLEGKEVEAVDYYRDHSAVPSEDR